jgi:hypothetical protein
VWKEKPVELATQIFKNDTKWDEQIRGMNGGKKNGIHTK